MIYCDPETGVCNVEPSQNPADNGANVVENTLLYFGDPMCSWCWGFAPEIEKLIAKTDDKYDFKLIMGGLRPGGRDPWNDQMKSYLREHWQHVIEKSGQPFSFELFERSQFEYNTEPPCRAVKTAQELLGGNALGFYHKIQHRFYAESGDPGELAFYQPICEQTDIDFLSFKKLFDSDQIKKRTQQDFNFTKHLGVQGFPSLIVAVRNQLQYLARGYSTSDQIMQRLHSIEKQTS